MSGWCCCHHNARGYPVAGNAPSTAQRSRGPYRLALRLDACPPSALALADRFQFASTTCKTRIATLVSRRSRGRRYDAELARPGRATVVRAKIGRATPLQTHLSNCRDQQNTTESIDASGRPFFGLPTDTVRVPSFIARIMSQSVPVD
jgi:hypothetical protein